MTAEETVTTFINALEKKDVDTALKLLTDDVEYDNVPMPTINGVDAVRDFLGPFVGGADEVEWVIHRQVASGDTVMNERTDRFNIGGRWIEIPVVGVWEVRDGRIALWRDYFDLNTFTNQLNPDSA